jgi:TRAP-type C4-dicarboxylate transport system permease small subunit
MWIFFKSNGVLHFFAVTIVITGIMLGINWKWGDPTSWIWKKIGYVWLHVTSTFMCAYFYIGAPKVNLKEVDVYALNEKWEDKMFTREDSLRKKFAYELKLAERPSTVLKEQIKDLNQTIDSFTTATAVLAAAKTDLKKQLALAKADGAIANEKTEAIKASFDSIAKSPTVSGGIQRLKRVPYGALLIVGLLIIISLFSSRFFKDFTMVPVKARRVYIPVVLAGVMLFLCFPYLQSLVWSSSEKRTPQEEVVVQSPKDSIAIPDKKKGWKKAAFTGAYYSSTSRKIKKNNSSLFSSSKQWRKDEGTLQKAPM